jgi:hypothetical protein
MLSVLLVLLTLCCLTGVPSQLYNRNRQIKIK